MRGGNTLTRLIWDNTSERFFETGIDRGVLYVTETPGVVWNGLTAMEESPSVGEAKAYYLDGLQYLNLEAKEKFEATLSAFSSPREFDECDGTIAVGRGLFATQQSRKSFGLTYRTRIGNFTHGTDHAYKIHIVYNALAQPTQRNYSTINEDPSATPLSWKLTTKPRTVSGAMPTSHLFIDSRFTSEYLLSAIEDILYGTPTTPSRLITPEELVNMFSDELVITLLEDGAYSAEGNAVSVGLGGYFAIDHASVVVHEDGTFEVL